MCLGYWKNGWRGTISAKAFEVIFHVLSFIILMCWCIGGSDTFVSLVCERNNGPLNGISEDSFHFLAYQWTSCMETWSAVDVSFYPLHLRCFVYCISGAEDFCKHPTGCLKNENCHKNRHWSSGGGLKKRNIVWHQDKSSLNFVKVNSTQESVLFCALRIIALLGKANLHGEVLLFSRLGSFVRILMWNRQWHQWYCKYIKDYA